MNRSTYTIMEGTPKKDLGVTQGAQGTADTDKHHQQETAKGMQSYAKL